MCSVNASVVRSRAYRSNTLASRLFKPCKGKEQGRGRGAVGGRVSGPGWSGLGHTGQTRWRRACSNPAGKTAGKGEGGSRGQSVRARVVRSRAYRSNTLASRLFRPCGREARKKVNKGVQMLCKQDCMYISGSLPTMCALTGQHLASGRTDTIGCHMARAGM